MGSSRAAGINLGHQTMRGKRSMVLLGMNLLLWAGY